MGVYIKNMEKPKNAFNCSIKINPEERRCIYTGKVFEETLSLLSDRPCDDCPLIEIDLVRCEECNRSGTDGENIFCMWLGALRRPTDFCSYGERRSDEIDRR